MKDLSIMLAVVFGMEVIDHVFGRAVGMAVAITALIGIVAFLWHAGKDAA
jgi:hypothetical protein